MMCEDAQVYLNAKRDAQTPVAVDFHWSSAEASDEQKSTMHRSHFADGVSKNLCLDEVTEDIRL